MIEAIIDLRLREIQEVGHLLVRVAAEIEKGDGKSLFFWQLLQGMGDKGL